jgi:hypothetical protein
VDGKKDGRGKFTWIDCSWYDGEWKGDFMHGTGIKREKDGRLFEVGTSLHASHLIPNLRTTDLVE